jgi:excisionase family DNA binding protein
MNDVNPEPLTVTVQMARSVSGLGHTTIYELIKSGRLRIKKIGRRTLISYPSLKALLSTEAYASDVGRL